MKIGIIGALQVEVEALKAKLVDPKITNISGMEFAEGTLCGKEVVVAVAGVGKVNAAMCCQTMILAFHPDEVINTGVAGGIGQGLSVLDVVVATAVVQHDMDSSPLGDPVGMISGLDMVEMTCDADMVGRLCAAAEQVGVTPRQGLIATGDQFIASQEQIARITAHFDAVAAEMEGGAIGQVCAINRVPFAVLRAISDGGDEAATMSFPQFAQRAAAIAVGIMEHYLAN